MATMLGPRLSLPWASRASTSTVSFSGARACWIDSKLRLWPSQIRPPPTTNTTGPVMPRGITVVMFFSSQLIDSRLQ